MKHQNEDSHLLVKIQDLVNGGTEGEYIADDNGLLWYVALGSILRLAIPTPWYPTFCHLSIPPMVIPE